METKLKKDKKNSNHMQVLILYSSAFLVM